MVGILIDSKYRKSYWCKSIYDSLIRRLRHERIPFCEGLDRIDGTFDTVFIISTDREWIIAAVTALNQNEIYPILICNQAEELPGCMYSCVCSDVSASMKNLLDLLREKGKTRLALYGINTKSLADIGRVDSLFNWRGQRFETMQIFTNDGSLERCFDSFFPHVAAFDAVICANDFAAVSLVRRLEARAPDALRNLSVVSCSRTQISEQYRDRILSLDTNSEQYGNAAVYVYNTLKKRPALSGMTVKVLHTPVNEPSPPPAHLQLELKPSEDTFYDDRELAEMLIVDKALQAADDGEKALLNALLENCTFEQIAERCFLTVGGVKYRIQKLLAESGAQSREELVSLLKTYLGDQ